MNYDGEAYEALRNYAVEYLEKMQGGMRLPKGVRQGKVIEVEQNYANIYAGNCLQKEEELKNLKKYEETLNEAEERLDLVQKQLNFYNKYLDKVL